VSSERALQDSAILGSIKERTPLFEFANSICRFLRVKLCHAPVIEKFTAAHSVAEVSPPVVRSIDVAHGGSDPTLGHHRVRLAEQ
jgi:hypothetical protein